MRCYLLLSGIVSGLVVSNALETYMNTTINNTMMAKQLETPRTSATTAFGSCYKNGRTPEKLEGCPTEIPLTDGGYIVAGVIYREIGNDIAGLACNGACGTWYAETKFSQAEGSVDPFGSVIINPGCTLFVFQDYQYGGTYQQFDGPLTLPNPKKGGVILNCGVPCIRSMMWTCKQVYPTCQPSDAWQPITELDNTKSSIPTRFTYVKTVGTEFSKTMESSMSVSATVSAEISASFFSEFSAKVGVSATTGFDWKTTDAETQSVSTTFDVQVLVPAGKKVQIQEVVGTCGGSTVHTQMFRVFNTANGQTVEMFKGKLTKHGKKRY